MAEASSVIATDPRRPGRVMLAVLCWCGRFYTLTREEADRRQAEGRHLCPDPVCGKGVQ